MSEARWTPPSPWQPHPEWWTADPDDADAAEYEVTTLVAVLVKVLQPEIVVETGTATGATAVVIGQALQDNGHGHLWTVEIDPLATDKARDRVAGLPVTVDCANSLEWQPPEPIDLAWIDSGDAATRCEEISAWQGKFRSGAVIGVHDTAPNMGREVLNALLYGLVEVHHWPALWLRTPRGVTLIQVPIEMARVERQPDPAKVCDCPELDGMVYHQQATCTDPVVIKLGWYSEVDPRC